MAGSGGAGVQKLEFLFDVIVGFDGEGFFPVLHGLDQLAQGEIDIAQVVEDGGVRFRGEFDGLESQGRAVLGPG